jgi:hypothetical protein
MYFFMHHQTHSVVAPLQNSTQNALLRAEHGSSVGGGAGKKDNAFFSCTTRKHTHSL